MELPVWQFVRIMVACEKRPNSRLLQANAEAWSEMDSILGELAASDFDAYSNLMMQTDVSLSVPSQTELRRVLDSLLRDMKLAKRKTRAGSKDRQDFEYEISELSRSLESLGGRVENHERDQQKSRVRRR